MSLLTREQIIEVQDIKYSSVEVPEWGGEVRLRSLSGADRATLIATYSDEEHLGKFDIFLIALAAVDGEGNRIFSVKDVDALSRKSSSALIRVAEAAKQLSGLSPVAEETAEKNS